MKAKLTSPNEAVKFIIITPNKTKKLTKNVKI